MKIISSISALFAIFLVFSPVNLLLAAEKASVTASSASMHGRETKTLRCGYLSYEPYITISPNNGEVSGSKARVLPPKTVMKPAISHTRNFPMQLI